MLVLIRILFLLSYERENEQGEEDSKEKAMKVKINLKNNEVLKYWRETNTSKVKKKEEKSQRTVYR